MLYLLVSRRAGDEGMQVTRTLHNFATWERNAEGEVAVLCFHDDMTLAFGRFLTAEERRRGRYFDKKQHEPSIEQMLVEVDISCSMT